MADTLANVKISSTVWVDLYAATGITSGNRIRVQNLGGNGILLHSGENAPTGTSGYNIIFPSNDFFVNDASSNGEWAKAISAEGTLNIAEYTE
ncbi:hypothetical protein AB832_08145 [Flavobacteriaceae bacterium (ex Bugula neritina AB1)]|jgi:hypothetical protein|nr:hypothetical protein AB832_08145 [Flavobacteriaceae bacterium (ex Bugula neritina AB1)]